MCSRGTRSTLKPLPSYFYSGLGCPFSSASNREMKNVQREKTLDMPGVKCYNELPRASPEEYSEGYTIVHSPCEMMEVVGLCWTRWSSDSSREVPSQVAINGLVRVLIND
jgi:hypothetical protein